MKRGTLLIITALTIISPAAFSETNLGWTLSPSGSSVRTKIGGGNRHVVVCNADSYVKWGDSTVTADATSLPISANEKWEDKSVPNHEYIAIYSLSATCYIYPVVF
jgi:hypothetical protein